ncbi:hypothetical protein AVEN_101627-1, partial [Araneus ventricosus]
TEEDSIEESSSTEEEDSLVEEDSAEENSLVEEDSAEERSSTEGDSEEEMKENWIEVQGLVIQDMNPIETGHRTVQIVIVGSGDSGKTKLIDRVFGDHSSFTVTNHVTRIEFRISLSTFFHIWMCDASETGFLKKTKFLDKTVFLFCYDVDNPKSFASLEETWIPPVLEGYLKRMYYFLVGIKRDPKTESKAVSTINREEQKKAIEKKAKELNRRFLAGWLIDCSIDDKRSLVNVFQSSIDVVYPRF